MGNLKFIVSRRNENDVAYKTFLEPSLQKLQVQVFQAVTQDGKTEESTAKKYNAIISTIVERNLIEDDDILVFCQEDISIIDNSFVEKIHMIFNQKPNISIVGVMGSSEINDHIEWWMNDPEKLRGHVLQNIGAGINKAQHLVKGPIGYYEDIVSIDKCIMFVKGKVVKSVQFDDELCVEDLFNVDFCVRALQKGFQIAIADILIYKDQMPENKIDDVEWNQTRLNLMDKWKLMGIEIPITINSFNFKRNEVMEIEL